MPAHAQMQQMLNGVWLVLVLVLGTTVPAHAQMRRCAQHTLEHRDLERLMRVMKAALAPSVRIDTAPQVCRNSGNAFSWLETRHRTATDGATEWWMLQCNRKRGDWLCERPEHKREISVKITIASQVRHLVIHFDERTSILDARELTQRALDVIEDDHAPLAECVGEVPGKTDPAAWSKAHSQYRLTPSQTELSATVSHENETFSVWLSEDGGLAITFQPKRTDTDPFTPICWSEWVIVT
jgi:hypothetical protein